MEIVKQWIVNGYQHLVMVANGDYYLGTESNMYGFDKISKEKAERLINDLPVQRFG